LQVGHPLAYSRLKDAAILRTLDEAHFRTAEHAVSEYTHNGKLVPPALVLKASLAEADADDRGQEMTGAVKLVASLAAVDGLVLMTPDLSLLGFGVKISSTRSIKTVYDGASFSRIGTRARKIDLSQFGTRHGSMLRYCAQDSRALGIVISQDGYVRLIMTVGTSLVLWDNLKLLGHDDFSSQGAVHEKERRKRRKSARMPYKLGYTHMPKTIDRLMKTTTAKRLKNGAKSLRELPPTQPTTRSPRKSGKVRRK
jgi:hypothetical protein